MLEWIPSPDDVLALKMSGRITGEDLDPVMDRLDAAMAKHDKVHVFVETESITSLELSAFPNYVGRALPLFGKLNRSFIDIDHGDMPIRYKFCCCKPDWPVTTSHIENMSA